MRARIDMNHPLTQAAGKRMRTVDPRKLLGLIFGGIGLLFLVLGVVFVLVSTDKLPMLADPEIWTGDTPDELALPMVGIVFAAMGLIFAVMGGIFLLLCRRQRLLREELLRYGTRTTGAVVDIVLDRHYEVNGRHPLRIMVQAQNPHTGELRTLRGPMMWETSLVTGDAVDVIFDPMDEKKYIVELPGETA